MLKVPVLHRASFGYLAQHPWQLALALLGICIGVGVMVAVDLANESARRAFDLSMDAVNGEATHQIVGGPAGVDESLYARLRVDDGLKNIAPVVEGYVDSANVTFHLLGVDPFAERNFREYSLPQLSDLQLVTDSGPAATQADGSGAGLLRRILTQPGAVLLPREAAVTLGREAGDALRIDIAGRQAAATVAAVLHLPEGRGYGNLMIADIASAQQWLGMQTKLSRIDVRIDARPGSDAFAAQVSALRGLLPEGVQLLDAEGRSQSLSEMSEAFMTNLTAMSLLALLIGVFLIYNSVAFAVVQRRSLLGVLRVLGLTRGQTFRLILLEALVLGIVGVLLGLALGFWLGEKLLMLVSRSINDLYYVLQVTEVAASPASLARGFLVGIGATLVAAAVPALEAASYQPSLAVVRSSLEQRSRRLLPWLAVAGITTAVSGYVVLYTSGTALVPGLFALFMVVFGLALCVPSLVRVVSGALAPLASAAAGMGARLAVAGVAASLSRTGVAIVALAVAVSATVGVSIMVDSFRGSVGEWLDSTLRSDIYVGVPRGSIDPELAGDIVSLSGIVDHSATRRVWLETEDGRVRLTAVRMAEAGYAGTLLEHERPDAVWHAFEHDGAVLVSNSYAYRHEVAAGDSLSLPAPGGSRRFRIAATYRSYDADLDAVLMSRSTYVSAWDDRSIDSLGIYLTDAAAAETVMQEIRRLSSGRQALLVSSNRELRERSMQIFDRTFVITDVLYWLAVSVAVVGILGAMLALQLERARELAVFRALGMTPAQLARMVLMQTGYIGLLSGLAAVPLGLVMAVLLVEVINRRAFGWEMDILVRPAVPASAIALAVLAALVAGAWPAWRAAQARPALAMREE